MRKTRRYLVSAATTLTVLFAVQTVFAHVTISPRQSTAGKTETYTIRVPTERGSPTVRIEAEFPMGLTVSDLEAKAGWEISPTMNDEGRMVGAVWSGGSIPPGQAEEFSFQAMNPSEETTLVWEVVQIHADGSRAEWAPEVEAQGD